MDSRLKERLIGAAVLVALGVWFIPWVLDGPAQAPEAETFELQLPAAQESAPFRTQTIDLTPSDPGDAAIVSRADDEPAAVNGAGDRERTEAPVAAEPLPTVAKKSPPVTSSSAPSGVAPAVASGDWVVQLGSFGDSANAQRLASRVGTYGYDARVSDYRAGGRAMHRVRVGPHPSREKAEAVASSLSAHGFVAQVVTVD
jgi:DedD protein